MSDQITKIRAKDLHYVTPGISIDLEPWYQSRYDTTTLDEEIEAEEGELSTEAETWLSIQDEFTEVKAVSNHGRVVAETSHGTFTFDPDDVFAFDYYGDDNETSRALRRLGHAGEDGLFIPDEEVKEAIWTTVRNKVGTDDIIGPGSSMWEVELTEKGRVRFDGQVAVYIWHPLNRTDPTYALLRDGMHLGFSRTLENAQPEEIAALTRIEEWEGFWLHPEEWVCVVSGNNPEHRYDNHTVKRAQEPENPALAAKKDEFVQKMWIVLSEEGQTHFDIERILVSYTPGMKAVISPNNDLTFVDRDGDRLHFPDITARRDWTPEGNIIKSDWWWELREYSSLSWENAPVIGRNPDQAGGARRVSEDEDDGFRETFHIFLTEEGKSSYDTSCITFKWPAGAQVKVRANGGLMFKDRDGIILTFSEITGESLWPRVGPGMRYWQQVTDDEGTTLLVNESLSGGAKISAQPARVADQIHPLSMKSDDSPNPKNRAGVIQDDEYIR